MRRLLLIPIAAVAAGSVCIGAAAAFGLSPGQVAAGNVPVARCDGDGFAVTYATSGGAVTSVTVAGIADPGCEGGTLRVTLTDAAGTDIGSGSGAIPADGDTVDNSLAVAVSPTPAEPSVAAIQLAIEGP